MPVIPAIWGNTNRKMAVQAHLDIKRDRTSKITKAKRASGVAQVIEHLHSKHKALNSTPSTTKKKGTLMTQQQKDKHPI
jgi:hypothetical protein